MTIDEFLVRFGEEFEETPEEQFVADAKFKNFEEWGSLTALSIIAMVDDEFEKRITGADIRNCETIEDLYNLILNK